MRVARLRALLQFQEGETLCFTTRSPCLKEKLPKGPASPFYRCPYPPLAPASELGPCSLFGLANTATPGVAEVMKVASRSARGQERGTQEFVGAKKRSKQDVLK
ncbi:hypothetical protein NDU88_005072 [Pleurodeles waltl]|uniref:Uncharacterized protein n=1 Tax=Pleurodeles waltl TaxID=8319 RepID=A0AAV7WYG7_PLEWA|nr:hypothetical protein NDU88_005072 [Pleurodeles waltl]